MRTFYSSNMPLLFRTIALALLLSTVSVCDLSAKSKKDSMLLLTQTAKIPKEKLDHEINYAQLLVKGSIDTALLYLEDLEPIYENSDEYAYARVISLKSWYLCYQSLYEEAAELAYKALKMQQENGADSLGIALTLNRIGMIHLQTERYTKAEPFIRRALALFKQIGYLDGVEMLFNNLGVMYSSIGQMDSTILYYTQSLNIRQQLEKHYWVGYSYFNIAGLYQESENFDSFQKYILLAEKTFKEKTPSGVLPAMVKFTLAQYYNNKNQRTKAIAFVEAGIEQSVKISNTEMVIQGKLLLADLLFQNEEYKKGYLVYEEYNMLYKKLDSASNVTAIAELEEKYQNAKKTVEIERLKTDKLHQDAKDNRFKMIILFGVIGLVFALIFSYYSIKRKQQLAQEELKARLEKLKLLALRSQMNPHFLFNSINTAQNFILDARKQDAYEYLEKFAKLLRIVLDSTSALDVHLADEIVYLKLYLDLESKRFNNSFHYSFEIDECLNDGVFEIPGMVLQPFVENAILHGIQNLKNRKGSLQIVFKKIDNKLLVTIEDNGVGRAEAKLIKEQKDRRYKSIALPNIKERINILNTKEYGIELSIEDLNIDGTPSGTRVQLTLPLS